MKVEGYKIQSTALVVYENEDLGKTISNVHVD
jgi:hypothetical protein